MLYIRTTEQEIAALTIREWTLDLRITLLNKDRDEDKVNELHGQLNQCRLCISRLKAMIEARKQK